MKSKFCLLLAITGSAFAQISQYPLAGGSSSGCTGSASVGYVATATSTGTSPACTWQAVGSASVTEGAINNSEFVNGGGTANAITGSTTTTYTTYTQGYSVRLLANATNTSATTIAVNTAPAVAITKNGTTPLVAGDITSGHVYLLVYDGTEFQLIASGTGGGSGTVTTTGSPATGNMSKFSGANAITNGDLSGDVITTGTLSATVKAINGVLLSGLATGILKNTTTTGVPSIAVAGDFPILNQSTTGNSATATALASTPTLCTTGNAPTGILANGNATGCASITGGSGISGSGTVHSIPVFTGSAAIGDSQLTQDATTSQVTSAKSINGPAAATATGATPTVDLSTCQRCEVPTLAANTTVSFSNPKAGEKFSVVVTQAASGGPFTVSYSGISGSTCASDTTASGVIVQDLEVASNGTTIQAKGCANPTGTPTFISGPTRTAPSTPASGSYISWFDSTNNTMQGKDSSGNLNTQVRTASSPASNQWVDYVATTGIPHTSQPAFSNLSGSVAAGQMPALTGDVTSSAGSTATTIAANAVTSAKMAIVNTRRVCDIAIGDTSATSAIADAQLGPQKRICYIPAAATIVELDVAADGGTPNAIVGKNHGGSITNIVSAALATAASGGIACSNTGGTTGIDGATTCSSTLQNTSLAAGDYLGLVSGTAGGTAKFMTIHVVYTVN